MRVEVQYALAFSLAAIIMVAGFWPTFYADPSQNEPVRTVHGILASGWLLILVAQPWLIASRRPGLHRRVGRLAVVWFVLLAASILGSIWRMVSEPVNTGDDLFTRQAVGFIDIIGLPLIAVLFALAVRSARAGRIANHRRYMACLVAVIVPTGMARLVTAITGHFRPVNIVAVEALVIAALLFLTIRDRSKTGTVFWPYLLTVLAIAGPMLLLPLVIDSSPWLALIRRFGYPA